MSQMHIMLLSTCLFLWVHFSPRTFCAPSPQGVERRGGRIPHAPMHASKRTSTAENNLAIQVQNLTCETREQGNYKWLRYNLIKEWKVDTKILGFLAFCIFFLQNSHCNFWSVMWILHIYTRCRWKFKIECEDDKYRIQQSSKFYLILVLGENSKINN